VYVAVPCDTVMGDPIGAPLSSNWTVPLGVPAAELTVAVKVTTWPLILELVLEVRTVADALAADPTASTV